MTSAPSAPLTTILDIRPVDDAGGVHYETVMSAQHIVSLVEVGLLKLEGNIRPDHMPGQRMGQKTRRKIDLWTEELLGNNAVIGNISIRANPEVAKWVIEEDDGQTDLHLTHGYLDCAVDSLSRIKALLKAAHSPVGTFRPDTRFAVRVWLVNDDQAARVAAIYNTRGDKVNDTAAKFAWQSNSAERMARELMNQSGHLSMDNIEVLKNNVSASSPKLTAFNTLSQAIETFWEDEPLNQPDEANQIQFLADFWNELVKVRPEFGRMSLKDRKAIRGSSVAGTALSIHGVIAVASAMYQDDLDPAKLLGGLKDTVIVGGRRVDYFSYENPVWQRIGVLVASTDESGAEHLSLRMSFQTRQAVGKELKAKLGMTS